MTKGVEPIKLAPSFFQRDVLDVAPDLIGKILVRVFDDGTALLLRITETEAYRGEEDLACHASKGKTKRTSTMYLSGGHIYMYLIYGMYWMLNIVTGKKEAPQAVLIRGAGKYDGPGKLTKALQLDKSFNTLDINRCKNLWVEDDFQSFKVNTSKRIGIDYAGDVWANKQWRFLLGRKISEDTNNRLPTTN